MLPSLTQGASVYSNEGEFVNILNPGNYFNNFETFASGDQGSTNASLSGGTPIFNVTLSTAANNNLYVATGTLPSGKALSTTVDATDLLLTFTSGNVTAIGAHFFSSDIEENRIAGALDIVLSDGTSLSVTNSSNGPVAFRGFTATNPITSLRLRAAAQYVTIDNLYVGAAGDTNSGRATLSIRPVSGTQLEVSWPLSNMGDVLRAKSSLSSSNWTDVVENDAPSNGFHRVLVSASDGMRFFQLQRP
ncbi:MAG TPA: hypothetical protein VK846_12140 [Candidatus Limnocylindria bacterium]|nr:hypothetical protein [Candidatus Limnocylindria bacterium]